MTENATNKNINSGGKLAICLAVAGFGYFLAALISILISRYPSNIATIWFANAVAIAVMVHSPYRQWPILFFTATSSCLLVNLIFNSYTLALSFTATNMLECAIAAILLQRFMAMPELEPSVKNILQLICFSSALPGLFSATLGAWIINAHGFAPFMKVWPGWYLGSIIGSISMLPLATLVGNIPQRQILSLLFQPKTLFKLMVSAGIALVELVYLSTPLIYVSLGLMLAALLFPLAEILLLNLVTTLTFALALSLGLHTVPPVTSGWEVMQIYIPILITLICPLLLAAITAGNRRYAQRLEIASAAANAANLAKSDFLAKMSHEIRTPMNGILGMLKLLHSTELSTRQLDYVDKAESSTQGLLVIINDILDFSKIEAGKLTLSIAPFTAKDLLGDLSAVLSSNPRTETVKLLIDVAPDLPRLLLGDALRLRQILLNLATNALKFTEQGEVVISIRINTHGYGSQAEIEFSVRDTGIGIPAEKLELIFEGFSQAESSIAHRFGGTGLGLAISRRLVRLMGGELQVESELGRGSRFFFTLPLKAVSSGAGELTANEKIGCPSDDIRESATEASLHPAGQFSSRLNGMRLLVVEDNLTNQIVARELLERSGAQVEIASSGLAGVRQALAAKPQFNAILMDIQMPDINGLEATRRLQADNRTRATPVIAMTANALPSDKEACRSAGMVDHIIKPIDLERLVATLLRHAIRPQHTDRRPDLSTSDGKAQNKVDNNNHVNTSLFALLEIDITTAIRRMGGDPALHKTITALFCHEAPTMLETLRQHIAAQDYFMAAQCAHSIKGQASTVGANGLKEASHRFEALLKQLQAESTPAPTAELALFSSKLTQTVAAMSTLTAVTETVLVKAGTLPTVSESQILAAAVRELAALLAQKNMRAVDAFEHLSKQWQTTQHLAGNEQFERLEEAINQINLELAHKECLALLTALG
jgi:signal transduction histidine kinase/CheY-like chemotaxis protein